MQDGLPETTPLLTRNRWPRVSPVTLIIPVAAICRLAIRLPSTTTFHVIQQLLCRLHYLDADSTRIPATGNIPDELCAIPDVQQQYAAALTAMAMSDGIGSILAYSGLGLVASRMGRKPAILLVVAVGLLANVLVITSKLIGSTTAQVGLLCMWMACNSLSQPLIIVFATNMYLVDLVGHEQRTSALSTLWGWSTLGSALSFVVGGSITAQFKDELPVYYVTGTIWIALFAYITLFIPESYPKHKRNALRREPGAVDSSSWIQQHILPIFEPLSLLKPVCDPETGQREWRLAICALHAFCVDLGGAYGATALIVYLTGVQRYTPQETGYALTTLNLVGFTVLTVIIPSLIPRLRRLYGPRDDHSLAQTRDCVDILVVFLSWVMDAAAFIFLALAESRIAQMTAVTLIGLSAGRHPVFRSLAVSGVNPLKQGQTLAAIEMVASVGKFLSSILMGGILSATISTVPQFVFYVQAAIVVTAASSLFFAT